MRSVQLSHSVVSYSAALWTASCQAFLSITNSQSLLKLTSIELMMSSNHLILCHPHLLLPSIFPSIRLFSNESALFKWVSSLHQVAKVLKFQLQHQSFQWTPRLISSRMGWLDLLAVQRSLKSLLQHHSSKASILWHSAFFTVQLSLPCATTGKTIALTRQTFVGKVTSLLFNMLSRRRQWHPTPVPLPGKSHGWRSLVGYSPWGC